MKAEPRAWHPGGRGTHGCSLVAGPSWCGGDPSPGHRVLTLAPARTRLRFVPGQLLGPWQCPPCSAPPVWCPPASSSLVGHVLHPRAAWRTTSPLTLLPGPVWPGCLLDGESPGQWAQHSVSVSGRVQILNNQESHRCWINQGKEGRFGLTNGAGVLGLKTVDLQQAEQSGPGPAPRGCFGDPCTAPHTAPHTGTCRSWTRWEERLDAGRSLSPGLVVKFQELGKSVDITSVVESGRRGRLGTGTPVRCGDGGAVTRASPARRAGC